MPLQLLVDGRNVDWQGQQFEGEELRVLASQARRHGGDAIGANDELRSQVECRRHHLDYPFVVEAPQHAFIVVNGRSLPHTNDDMSELQVLIE